MFASIKGDALLAETMMSGRDHDAAHRRNECATPTPQQSEILDDVMHLRVIAPMLGAQYLLRFGKEMTFFESSESAAGDSFVR